MTINLPANEKRIKRKRVQVVFKKPSLTKQEFKQEVDINEIIRKFKSTGELPQRPVGLYMDTTVIPDYQSLQDQVVMVNDYFMSLPSGLRARFNNDPAQLLDWASDTKNTQEATSIGVLKPGKVTQTVPEVKLESKTENKENLTKPSEK